MEPIYAKEPCSNKSWLSACFAMLVILVFVGVGASLWIAFTSFVEALGESFRGAVQQAFEPMGKVIEFEGNIRVGNIETAYSLTSKEFQECQSLEQFAKFIEEHQELRSHWVDLAGEEPTDNSCVYQITVELEKGSRFIFKLRLRKQENGWKVSEIVLPTSQ